MIYMWQKKRGKRFYRFQTSNKNAASMMKRRKKFKLSGYGFNCGMWIFVAEFSRPDIARKALKTISGGKIEYDNKEDIFYCRINELNQQKEAA
jgi:hypothetical protein